MSYEIPVIRSATGNTIRISRPVIPPFPVTYLSTSVSSGGTTLTVLDNGVFSQNDFVMIGAVGVDKTEIVRITGAVTAGLTLTVGALSYDHAVDAPVAKFIWDQIEISGASTVTGSKTVITTLNIQPDRPETIYTNTGTTYAFYFARFKNSFTSTFSSYSDAAAAGGYAANTVRKIKDTALQMAALQINENITEDFLNNEITNCEEDLFHSKRVWSWAYDFDEIIGSCTQGAYSVSLPSDIADPNSNKSIVDPGGVRIQAYPDLYYITKAEFDLRYINVIHSTLSVAVAAIDTTITLTDSGDFPETGSINVGSSTFTYTANNQSTGVLTLSAAAGTTIAAGTDVWQNSPFGIPTAYTVWEGKMYFDIPFESTIESYNIYLSSYKKPTAVDSDSDTVNAPDNTIYHNWLVYKMLLRQSNGEPTPGSNAAFAMYQQRKINLMRQDRTGQRTVLRPRINTVRSRDYDSIQVLFSNEQP